MGRTFRKENEGGRRDVRQSQTNCVDDFATQKDCVSDFATHKDCVSDFATHKDCVSDFANPKGIAPSSPGLRGTSYPGCERKNNHNPEGVAALQICAIALFASFSVIAHNSPEHEIEALNKKIARSGATAELLTERATEWRALGKYDEASRDLQKALLIKSNSIPLILEYASVELERGNVCNTETIISNGLMRAATDTDRAALHMLRAEVSEGRGLYAFALDECEKAMTGAEPQLEWHLTRARLMGRLGRHAQAAAALKQAYEKTPNVVLEIEWIEAMIDAGQNAEALERISHYTAHGRWRNAWLIRQARAQLGLHRREAAQASLAAALAELEQRINPAKVDATLLADRAMAHLLRGDRDSATKDMDRICAASKGQVPENTMARLEWMFSEQNSSRQGVPIVRDPRQEYWFCPSP